MLLEERLAGEHGRALAAHRQERIRPVDAAHRVAAEEGERRRLGEVVAERLERDGIVGVAVGPEKRHHLAVDAHVAGAGAVDEVADHLGEALGVGGVPIGEPGQGGGGIEDDEPALLPGNVEVDARHEDLSFDPGAMVGGRHDDGGAIGQEAGNEEPPDGIREVIVVFVERDDVVVAGHSVPGPGPKRRIRSDSSRGIRRGDGSTVGSSVAQEAPTAGASVPDAVPAFPADVIPIQYHFNMLSDGARMDGFHRAIQLAVRPGMRVVDLGGGTGVLSWFAAARGAARVWCVEKLPEMAVAARRALADNVDGDRVTVVNADAFEYLPPEPVDVVLCEMLHTGLLREKQVQVIDSFKRRYLERFGGPLPAFVPEATLQAVQPVQQDFDYYGYRTATPIFQDARCPQPRTLELGPPLLFQTFTYDAALPQRCALDAPVGIEVAGQLNAVRFITKNLLAIDPVTGQTAEWIMGYLVMPLAAPLVVQPGDRPTVSFDYRPGDELAALAATLDADLTGIDLRVVDA